MSTRAAAAGAADAEAVDEMRPWEKVERLHGANPDVWKYVFAASDAVAEAVLYRYKDFATRTVICCSTQSGCPVGCRFCGAGDYFVRSLGPEEIVAQVDHLHADQGIDPSKVERLQIMFMSMGEPLLNWRSLERAIRELHVRYPRGALLISTSGPRVDYAPVRALSQQVATIGLQFSVHESSDEARDRLIPFREKLDLASIAHEGELWSEATGRRPFFNYCAHEHNISHADVARLGALFDPAIWECTVSVVCERTENVAAANERQREVSSTFMERMIEAGFSVRMFDPAGQDDIGGGCGQLWFVQDWMRRHPDRARRSIGHGLPIVRPPALERI
jgi:23S rRNA (adenine2503-C2)-methyltransferase